MSSVHSPSSDKENLELLQGLAEQMLEKGEFLSKPPLFATRSRTDYCLDPWHGFNEFRVWIPEPTAPHSRASGGGYQVGVMENCPKLYVQRGRRWPLAIGFRPSLTPIDFSIRITPHFVDEDRSNDIIERCSKHAVPSADIKGRSIIEILNPGAIYLTENTLQGIPIGQISVLFPLNVIGLLEQSQERDTPEAIHSSFSQSKLLAAVQCVIHCRINCFNSCFGLNLRGEIDLLITLEARERADPGSPYTVYGTQKVRVRCCACPYRDSRGLCTETELQPNVTASPCTTSNQCASRRRNFRRLSLNLSQRNTSFLSSSRTDHPSPTTSCPDVTVNGRRYKLLLVESDEQREFCRLSRNLLSLKTCMESGIRTNPKRIGRMFDRLEQCVAERAYRDTVIKSKPSVNIINSRLLHNCLNIQLQRLVIETAEFINDYAIGLPTCNVVKGKRPKNRVTITPVHIRFWTTLVLNCNKTVEMVSAIEMRFPSGFIQMEY